MLYLLFNVLLNPQPNPPNPVWHQATVTQQMEINWLSHVIHQVILLSTNINSTKTANHWEMLGHQRLSQSTLWHLLMLEDTLVKSTSIQLDLMLVVLPLLKVRLHGYSIMHLSAFESCLNDSINDALLIITVKCIYWTAPWWLAEGRNSQSPERASLCNHFGVCLSVCMYVCLYVIKLQVTVFDPAT